MKERPILFSAPMVRAILDGSKTQTRRVVKGMAADWLAPGMFTPEYVASPENDICPFGQPGDRLWVRETHQMASGGDGPCVCYKADFDRWQPPFNGPDYGGGPSFDYDEFPSKKWVCGYWAADVEESGPWNPSIHMPRWASRITLEVTDVRVERLHDISGQDSIAEGIEPFTEIIGHSAFTTFRDYLTGATDRAARQSFETLWQSINGPASWAANPWVWVVKFQRIKP